MNLIVEADDDVMPPPQMFERELTEAMSFEDTGLKREELPAPTLWRVLVLPRQPKKMSKGGIALPDQIQEAEAHLNYIGQVIAMGPLAGKSDKFKIGERFLWDVKIGDWCLFGRYSGQVITYKGVKLLMLNDDDLTGVVPGNPTAYRVYA